MNQNPDTIHVLVVEPGKKPCPKEISSDLTSLQKAVGGYIQAVYPFEEPVAILCDEEGKLKGLPLNRALRDEDGHAYDVLSGTFLVVGLGEENFTSLRPEHMKQFQEKFNTPEVFIHMDGKLRILPMTEARPSVLDKLSTARAPHVPAGKNPPAKEER